MIMTLLKIGYDFFNLFQSEGNWVYVIDLIIIITISFPLVVILLENRNPIKSISWILVLVLLPVIGVILYLYFGINFRKEKIFNKKEISDAESYRHINEDHGVEIDYVETNASPKIKSKTNLMRLLINNSRSRLSINNNIIVYNSGIETFDSIIREMEFAKDHIHLEYYIIEDDEIGNRIKDLLISKSQQGIEVRLIYDDVGSWGLTSDFVDEMTRVGIEVYSFLPVKSYRFANKINYRNHRKIIVVDGRIGFVGGINIADRYLKGRDGKGFWRDTHLRLEGDSVKSLQEIFLVDWYFMSKKILSDKKYFPENEIRENHLVQISPSGPDSDWSCIMQTFFSAIATAKDYVYISTPYFLPNESIQTAIRTAALSGINVKIILPEKNDSFLTNYSSRSYIKNLLEAGVEVYFYHKGYTHSKILIVDDIFSSVGTANMDIRSFDQNFEVNALIYDEEITANLKDSFKDDLTNSVLVLLSEYEIRPLIEKFKESIARLFSPLL